MNPTIIKPGYKTSEFWFSIAVSLAGAYIAKHELAANVLTITNAVVASVGMLIALLSQLGYGANRRMLKIAQVETYVQHLLALLTAQSIPPATTPTPEAPPPSS